LKKPKDQCPSPVFFEKARSQTQVAFRAAVGELAVAAANPWIAVERFDRVFWSRKRRAQRLFFQAAHDGDFAEMTALLPRVDPKQADPERDGMTALMHAAHRGHVKAIEALLPVSEPFARAKNGQTALMFAAFGKNPDAVRLLLPILEDAESEGRRALGMALLGGTLENVKLLLPWANGARPMPAGSEEREQCRWLQHAVSHGTVETVKLMLSVCDAKLADKTGETALMAAARIGDVEKVRLLLPVSDAKARNDQGWTALMSAVSRRGPRDETACAEALIPFSDCWAVDEEGSSAFDMAVDVNWELADKLNFWASSESIRKAIARAAEDPTPHEMPRCRARLEAEEIQKALQEAPALNAARSEEASGSATLADAERDGEKKARLKSKRI